MFIKSVVFVSYPTVQEESATAYGQYAAEKAEKEAEERRQKAIVEAALRAILQPVAHELKARRFKVEGQVHAAAAPAGGDGLMHKFQTASRFDDDARQNQAAFVAKRSKGAGRNDKKIVIKLKKSDFDRSRKKSRDKPVDEAGDLRGDSGCYSRDGSSKYSDEHSGEYSDECSDEDWSKDWSEESGEYESESKLRDSTVDTGGTSRRLDFDENKTSHTDSPAGNQFALVPATNSVSKRSSSFLQRQAGTWRLHSGAQQCASKSWHSRYAHGNMPVKEVFMAH